MPRKTSFCNGTLLRSDLRHYWPAGFLYVLVWLVLLPIPLLQTGFDYARSWADRPELLAAELHNIYYSAMTGSMVLAVLAGIVMPMAVYAYLMAPRAVGLMHALPVKRTTQYFSHFAAGFGLLTGGNVLIFLLSVLAQLPYGGADWAAAGLWLLVTELLELFFLSLGTLCAMATGWLLAIPVLYGAVNFTALLLCTVVQYLQRLFYFGFDSTTYPVFVEWLTPTITLSEAVCSYWGDWVTRDSREVYLRALPERALTVLAVYTAAALALRGEPEAVSGALALALGIGLQNIPEGAAVSLPLAQAGQGSRKAFCAGAASGLVEPLGALLALALAGWVSAALPWLMSAAAGCMVCVTAQEMIPEAVGQDEPAGVISVVLGFALMMALDIAL